MCITPNKTTFVAIEWRNWGKPIQAVNKIFVLCWTIQQHCANQPSNRPWFHVCIICWEKKKQPIESNRQWQQQSEKKFVEMSRTCIARHELGSCQNINTSCITRLSINTLSKFSVVIFNEKPIIRALDSDGVARYFWHRQQTRACERGVERERKR